MKTHTTILVTGANGLLGTHVIIQLLKAGYTVQGMVRDLNSKQVPDHPKLHWIVGDITSKPKVQKAVKDCDAVIHTAGLSAQNRLSYKEYKKVNVTGTTNLLQAAANAGVKTFLYISTANTIGYGPKNNPGKEGRPPKRPFTNSMYVKSKLEAEKQVLAFSNQLKTVLLHPSFMLGAYDAKPSSGKVVHLVLNNKTLFYPPGGKNIVNTKDAAIAIVAALERGENKQSYLLVGENVSYKKLFKKIARSTSQTKKIYLPLPKWGILVIGVFGEILRKLQIQTALSYTNTKILCVKNYYTNQKAHQELGVDFQTVNQGIEEALYWIRNKK